jgi:riboflavin kinase/FMN adenylyltransferase
VYGCKPVVYKDDVVSSSRIRQAILSGALNDAQAMLGRPFSMFGIVKKERQFGSLMGVPTANLKLFSDLLPPNGVYVTRICLGTNYFAGATNIGVRPTFAERDFIEYKTTVETHILDFKGNLYGEEIELEFVKRLRDEKKFSSIVELKEAIDRDINEAKSLAFSRSE